MSLECIKSANLEDTGFNYTMSLIQGKYKMFIFYTSRHADLQHIIGEIFLTGAYISSQPISLSFSSTHGRT